MSAKSYHEKVETFMAEVEAGRVDIDEAISIIAMESDFENYVNREVGWDDVSTAYKEAQEARKALLGPLPGAVRRLRKEVAKFIYEGGSHDRVSLREIDPGIVIEDADAIPEKYKIPDDKKLKRLAKALGEDFDIPGVKRIQRHTVVVKEKR